MPVLRPSVPCRAGRACVSLSRSPSDRKAVQKETKTISKLSANISLVTVPFPVHVPSRMRINAHGRFCRESSVIVTAEMMPSRRPRLLLAAVWQAPPTSLSSDTRSQLLQADDCLYHGRTTEAIHHLEAGLAGCNECGIYIHILGEFAKKY